MQDPTKWLTFSLGPDQIRAGLELTIEDRLLKAIQSLSFPVGAVFYLKQPKLTQSSLPVVLYLPPTTAALCRGLSRDYPWMECAAPDLSELAAFPGEN